MANLAEAVEALACLNEHQIRIKLWEEGIRGRSCAATKCPVAKYLYKVTGVSVWVTPHNIYTDPPKATFFISIPPSIREFIFRFDTGLFPELEEEE